MMWWRRPVFLLALLLTTAVVAEDDWMECTKSCKCKWVSGKKTAECSNSSLTTVPDGLSPQIQSLTLSGNSINELTKDAFYSVNLKNVHKIFLHDCHIRKLNEAAFRGLEILIELDLSNNEISKLHPGTFKDTGKLRVLNLQRNPIQRLDDNLFTNLIFLQTIDLSDCQLNHIGHKTFYNVSKLQTLKLGNNRLKHIKPETFIPLVKISYIVLLNNPWQCDCQLKEFHDWMTSRNLTIDSACVEPHSLQGRMFRDLKSSDFECYFKITFPSPGAVIKAENGNTTLSCKVVGYPQPNLHWVFNSRYIDTLGDHRHMVSRGVEWVNLTIIDTQESDDGTYTCVANGSGLMEERHVSLVVQGSSAFGGPVAGMSDTLWLIVGLVIGVFLLLIIVIVMFCCFCRHPQNNDKKSHQIEGLNGTSGDVTLDPDQSKSLLVNPVQKPPRRAEMQPLVNNSSSNQITSGKSPHLDRGSVCQSGSSDDHHMDQSTDSMDSHEHDEIEPPDLLSFPVRRGHQTSPAGSTASTAPDSHHLPSQHGPQSPVHHYAQSLCSTLPYSRSHSPFTPVVQPRQGYVTIPRRPRVPSWASMPASSPVCLPGDPLTMFKLEPVYDNLGPRTTADGSSVLSLNKVGDIITPMRGRALPPTPNHHQNGTNVLPPHYAPIVETELSSPLLSRAINHSTPNINVDPEYNRSSPEGALLLRRGEEKKKGAPITVVNGHSGNRNSIKVPPKPPPKPKKKKNNSDATSPLYEDEGEDGTEV